MSLSNSSRVDAIRAIDQLSLRLGGSASRSSLSSSVTKRSGRSASSSKSNRSRGSDPGTGSPRPRGHARPSSNPSGVPREQRKKHESSSRRAKSDKETKTPRLSSPHQHQRSARVNSVPGHQSSVSSRTVPLQHRMSVMTTSTNSTKLGEIPERKWRPRYEREAEDCGEYAIRPVYPLRLSKSPPGAVKKKFLGLF